MYIKSVSLESVHFSNFDEIFSEHLKIIIAIFNWIKLKFAAQISIIKTSFEPIFQVILKKNNREINKMAKKYIILS